MCLISSPGEYSLCSANSTDDPWCGERCRPDSAPSTTVRALSAKVPMRDSATGSRNLTGIVLGSDGVEQAIDERRRRHALGLGLVVDDQAVLQRRPRQGAHVLGRHGETSVEDGARLAG